MITQHRIQKGFTLVELMVGLTVGLLISGVAVAVFIANKQTSRVSNTMSRFQEGFRYIGQVMSRDIRMAGFAGCSREVAPTTVATGTTADTTFTQAIRGFENSDPVPALVPGIQRLPGTDVLRLQFTSATGFRLAADMGAPTDSVTLNATAADFSAGDIAVIADCSNSEVFRVSGVAAGPGTLTLSHAAPANATSSFARAYDAAAEVFDLVTAYYYVTETAEATPRRVLVKRVLRGTTLVDEELAEGVEDLQIVYGEGGRYVTADNVGNWANVTGVRVCIITRSPDDGLATANQRYFNCNGTAVNAPDRRLRAPVFFAATLRNR